jgi:hypothetical protein
VARDRGGRLTISALSEVLKWDVLRSEQTLEFLEAQGMAWIDNQGKEREWFVEQRKQKNVLS